MSATATSLAGARRGEQAELAEAFAALRERLGLAALLVALTALAWWSTVHRMAGMDAGPGTDLGALGWFLGVWLVMMAAMMLPSLLPTVALYARMTRRRGVGRPLLFTAGYLVVWGAVGLLAYGIYVLGRDALGSGLAWSAGGRWAGAGVLGLAAAYELTPLKSVCLVRCRSANGFLRRHWRPGLLGAARMGAGHATWCLGCCWALMAALFALGVMSLTWMTVVGGLIVVEKTIPWRRTVTWLTALVLLALAVAMAAAPHEVPGLVVPGSHAAARAMGAMMH